MPNSSYYAQANPDLLCRIPVQAATVVEVGCGAGALGAAYKAIHPQCTYIGVEVVQAAALQARQHLDHVFEVDVERDPLPSLPDGIAGVDCLVYGDVLEHLRDPQAVLSEQLRWLSDDGLVLACIPNVQHWSTLLNLLHGRWPQNDDGLFDRTHLRWFTRSGMVELMQSCGLVVHDITPRIFQADQARAVLKQLEPALPGLGLQPQELLAGISPLQYVLRAGRRATSPLLISGLTLSPLQPGMAEVRMQQPLASLASDPAIRVATSHESLRLLPADSSVPRLMIWQRQTLRLEEDLPKLRQAIRAGYVLISEYDDDPSRWLQIAANQHLCFTGMHAVQVSTPLLAEEIRPHNPELMVFENCITSLPPWRDDHWPQPGDGRPLRLFFGALNRQLDWAPWMDAFNQLLADDPAGWEIEVVHDQAFFEALHTTRKRFTPTCPYGHYRQRMASCHVAFLPLADTRFNRMKSDLKFIEAASHGLAVLASPVVYAESLRPGQTGELFSSAAELVETLREWRQDPSRAMQLGVQARAYVRDQRLQAQQTPRRLAWYRSLWERREELTAALLQRVPELAMP